MQAATAASTHGVAVVTKPVAGVGAASGYSSNNSTKGTWAVRRLRARSVIGMLPWSQSSQGKVRNPFHATKEDVDIVSVQELADGSMVFAFGACTQELTTFGSTFSDSPLDGVPVPSSYGRVPRRWPSSFQKRSPITIPAARRDGGELSSTGISLDVARLLDEHGHVPRRLPSSFYKKSPIPNLFRRVVRPVSIPQATNSAIHREEESNHVKAVFANHIGESNGFQLPDFRITTRPAQDIVAAYNQDYRPKELSPVVTMARRSNKHQSVPDDENITEGSKLKATTPASSKRKPKSEDIKLQHSESRETKHSGGDNATASSTPSTATKGGQSSKVKSTTVASNTEQKLWSQYSKGGPQEGRGSETIGSLQVPCQSENYRPLRPLSIFVKPTPIPVSSSERKVRPSPSQHEIDALDMKSLQGRVKAPKRSKSKFVKQSPVPCRRGNAVSNEVEDSAEVVKQAKNLNGAQVVASEGESVLSRAAVQSELIFHDGSFVQTRREGLDTEAKQSSTSMPGRMSSGVVPVVEVPAELIVQDGSFIVETERKVFIEDPQRAPSEVPTLTSGDGLVEDDQDANIVLDNMDSPQPGSKVDSLGFLDSYKLVELRNLAKSQGLKGYSKLKKQQLIDLIKASKGR